MSARFPKASALLSELRLCGPIMQRIALVVAHPDDDIIAAAGHLARFRRLTLIHVTVGAPGANSSSDVGRVRKAELVASLRAAAAQPERQLLYDLPDGAVVEHLPELVRRLTDDLAEIDVVLTHPFEGGHIDHDACAFAVSQACDALAKRGGAAPDRAEFSGYHNRRGKVRAGEFWHDPLCPAVRIDLAPDAAARRIAAFACHRSQEGNLRYFYLTKESFRLAPDYNFMEPPPPKATLYDAASGARLAAQIQDMNPIQDIIPSPRARASWRDRFGRFKRD